MVAVSAPRGATRGSNVDVHRSKSRADVILPMRKSVAPERLVQTLGEAIHFFSSASRRSKGDSSVEARRKDMMEWLLHIKDEEFASLLSVVDTSFVKTMLSMGMSSQRRRKGEKLIQGSTTAEFQIIPDNHTFSMEKKKFTGRRFNAQQAKEALPTTPKEFTRRPLMHTDDGDTFGGFRTSEYDRICRQWTESLRLLNTHCSCDTIALSLDALLSDKSTGVSHRVRQEVLRTLNVLSNHQFLSSPPSENAIKYRAWGETKWKASEGYSSIPSFIANVFELNIWYHWHEHQKSSAYTIPTSGLPSKKPLRTAWMDASATQRQNSLKTVSSQALSYLQEQRSHSAQSSLTLLSNLIDHKSSDSDDMFSCSFRKALEKPEVAAFHLLVAEHLQDQCSILLSDLLLEESLSTKRNGKAKTQKRRQKRKKKKERQKAPPSSPVQTPSVSSEDVVHKVAEETASNVLNLSVEAASAQLLDTDDWVEVSHQRHKKMKEKSSSTPSEELPASTEKEVEQEDPPLTYEDQASDQSSDSSDHFQSLFERGYDAAGLTPTPTPFGYQSLLSSPSSPFFLSFSSSSESPSQESEARVPEWQFPSFLSSRPTSTVSGLDWDFHNWHLKPEHACNRYNRMLQAEAPRRPSKRPRAKGSALSASAKAYQPAAPEPTYYDEKEMSTKECQTDLSFGTTEDEGDETSLDSRVARLENDVAERIKKVDDLSATFGNDLSTLKQSISLLSDQLRSVETELSTLKLAQESVASSLSNVQLTADQTSPPSEYRSTNTNSLLGPFVSVPMSVLPPRSKLHWDICEFVSQLQASSSARVQAQVGALRLCTATVRSLWPRAQVRPYGSFVSGLILPSSDLDLVICLPKVRRDAPADAAGVLEGRNAIKETWQQNLSRKLRQEPWVLPDTVQTLPHATIPIITLVTAAPYNVRLDISFEGPRHNGLETNDVVLSLMHEFPPLAPLMLVLKSLAIDRGFALTYSGGLSSYAMLLMVARYLQEHRDQMLSDSPTTGTAQSSADFGMMLMGFLDFYGNRFDPRTTGISVASRCFLNRESMMSGTNGRTQDVPSVSPTSQFDGNVPESSVSNTDLLSSPGSKRYSSRLSLDAYEMDHVVDQAHDPHKFDPVYIEDPLRPSNNVGRNCFRIMQIRRAFATAYSTLMAASMSPSVLPANRNALVAGVPLHPENLLRSLFGSVTLDKSKESETPAVETMSYHGQEVYGYHAPPNYPPPPPNYGLQMMPHQYPRSHYNHHVSYRSEAAVRRHSESEGEVMKGFEEQERKQPSPTMRKGPARSLSFADVVVGGSRGSRRSTSEVRRKGPGSPLGFTRSVGGRRSEQRHEDSINERWETRDDFWT